jgi:N-acetylglucosaminyldiphosphoundecaprenol N-acetyl-beta-D-mannosaminyltransferase
MEQAIKHIISWISEANKICRYIVTPNVNHIVLLQNNEELKKAYENASLILTDGKPVYFALKLLRKPIPEILPGSDLVPMLLKSVKKNLSLKVFLLGAAPGVAAFAAKVIEKRWPAIKIVGFYSPPIGFEKIEFENQKILTLIDRSRPDVLIVGLGAPKQELWTYSHVDLINAKVALCVGATIDFIAGNKKRAPKWIRTISCEWIYRMLTEPGRLIRRYLYDGLRFPFIVFQELFQKGYIRNNK